MAESIKTGLASFGMSGMVFHGPLLKAHPGFTIQSILERTHNYSRELYGESKIVRSFDELCRDDDIELIVVNTPDHTHFELAGKALEAGKHVVVEKPFTQKYSEAARLMETAEKKGLMVSVFQNRRWDGDFLTVRKVIEEGLLGRLTEFESHFDRFRNFVKEGTWKENPDTGTGTLYNLGSHMIDQAMVLFGMPESVYADIRTMRPGGKVDDSFDLHLKYDGIKVVVRGGYLVREAGPRYILHGTEGSFLKWGLDPQEEALKQGNLPTGDDWGKDLPGNYGILNTNLNDLHVRGHIETQQGDYPAFYENIYRVLRLGDKPAVPAGEAANVIRVIEAAYQSAGKEKVVTL